MRIFSWKLTTLTEIYGIQRNEYFLLDIVSFERFDDYLKLLESDKGAMFHLL
jgi:hypothetical protein